MQADDGRNKAVPIEKIQAHHSDLCSAGLDAAQAGGGWEEGEVAFRAEPCGMGRRSVSYTPPAHRLGAQTERTDRARRPPTPFGPTVQTHSSADRPQPKQHSQAPRAKAVLGRDSTHAMRWAAWYYGFNSFLCRCGALKLPNSLKEL